MSKGGFYEEITAIEQLSYKGIKRLNLQMLRLLVLCVKSFRICVVLGIQEKY